jgi:hypothetical protein
MNTSFFRSTLLALAALALPHTANASLLLAGWHDFNANNEPTAGTDVANESPDYIASGFSGFVSKGGQASVGNGGDDGGTALTYYGNSNIQAGNGIGNDGYLRILSSTVTFAITNVSGPVLQLDKLFFDAARQAGSPVLNISWNIVGGASGSLGTETITANSGGAGASADYADYSRNLAGIPALGLGQTIQFLFQTGSTGLRIDNIAITAIPEPASLIALACVLGSGLFLRQRPRQLAPGMA